MYELRTGSASASAVLSRARDSTWRRAMSGRRRAARPASVSLFRGATAGASRSTCAPTSPSEGDASGGPGCESWHIAAPDPGVLLPRRPTPGPRSPTGPRRRPPGDPPFLLPQLFEVPILRALLRPSVGNSYSFGRGSQENWWLAGECGLGRQPDRRR